MRNLIKHSLILGIVLASTFNLQAQDKTGTAEMLQNKEKKEEVFKAIVENPELKKEMMQHMMSNAEKDSASCKMMGNMMMDDAHMMDMMMNGMMEKAESDDGMCKKMCMMMMDNDKMMNMMDEMKGKKSKEGEKKEEKSGMDQHMDNQHN